MSSFEEYQPSILPAWLQDINGTNYAGVLGRLKDTVSNYARAAAVGGMPAECIAGLLPAIGYERQLPRGPAESEAHYRERLRTAWEAWRRAGTPLGMLLQFEVLYPGIPIVIVQQARRAFTLNPDTSLPDGERLIILPLPAGSWRFDRNGGLPVEQGFWSRFGVIFPGPLPPTWTSVISPPDGASAPTAAEVNTLIAVGNKWKPAKATWKWIKVAVGGARMWGYPPTMKWADPDLVWGMGSGSIVTFNTTGY